MDDPTDPLEVLQLRLVVEAEDFDAAVAFYRDTLGLPVEFAIDAGDGASVVALQAGRATLELVSPAQRRYIDEVEVGREVSREIRVAFEVTDVEGATDRLVQRGGTAHRSTDRDTVAITQLAARGACRTTGHPVRGTRPAGYRPHRSDRWALNAARAGERHHQAWPDQTRRPDCH